MQLPPIFKRRLAFFSNKKYTIIITLFDKITERNMRMNKIGGFFTFDTLNERENNFFQNLCPVEGDIRFLMSGRCAIYYALEDLKLTDKKQVAYVPIYTCETVLDPFVKAGYKLVFYDIDKDMKPIFDYSVINQISVISICGYYGFCNYDREAEA